MLYKMSSLYKRDTSFTFCDEENSFHFLDVQSCREIAILESALIYQVDKIDDYLYLLNYDVLPTIGGILVSSKFKSIFSDLENKEVQYLPVVIRDRKKQECTDFFCLNILHSVSVMDRERSLFLPYEWDSDDEDDCDEMDVIQPFYCEEKMGTHRIVRMTEDTSFIIVTEEFKTLAKKNKLKGVTFDAEGATIYTEIGLSEAWEKMKQIYG